VSECRLQSHCDLLNMFGHAHRLRNVERMHKYYGDWVNTKSASHEIPDIRPDYPAPQVHEEERERQGDLGAEHALGKPKWRVSRHMPLFGAISALPTNSSQIETIASPSQTLGSAGCDAHAHIRGLSMPPGILSRADKEGMVDDERDAQRGLDMMLQTVKLEDEWPYILQGPSSLTAYQKKHNKSAHETLGNADERDVKGRRQRGGKKRTSYRAHITVRAEEPSLRKVLASKRKKEKEEAAQRLRMLSARKRREEEQHAHKGEMTAAVERERRRQGHERRELAARMEEESRARLMQFYGFKLPSMAQEAPLVSAAQDPPADVPHEEGSGGGGVTAEAQGEKRAAAVLPGLASQSSRLRLWESSEVAIRGSHASAVGRATSGGEMDVGADEVRVGGGGDRHDSCDPGRAQSNAGADGRDLCPTSRRVPASRYSAAAAAAAVIASTTAAGDILGGDGAVARAAAGDVSVLTPSVRLVVEAAQGLASGYESREALARNTVSEHACHRLAGSPAPCVYVCVCLCVCVCVCVRVRVRVCVRECE
jgi:hypothetical protein